MSPGTLWPCCFLCATQTFLSSSRWDVCVPAGRREALPAGACPTEWLCDDLLKHLTRTQLARFGPLTSSVHWAHTWDLRFFSPHATALLQGLFKTGNALMNQGSDGLWNSSQLWSEKSKSPSVTGWDTESLRCEALSNEGPSFADTSHVLFLSSHATSRPAVLRRY